jgi:hypothetical protein
MVISIKKAEYVKEYEIRLLFSDGAEKVIDFQSFLNTAKNPMTRKYLDKKLFSAFYLVYGDIVWNDYELCFPVWNLYEGKI